MEEVFADNEAAPTFTDIKYGSEERQTLDLWLADAKLPTPLLVHIHGGGWVGGDKKAAAEQNQDTIQKMLRNGISFAAVNYRFTPENKLPTPVYDAARAIQFLRYKAKKFNIDKKYIAATGRSAGGCTSLWLATHADMTDPSAEDPVLRESTRLCGALVTNAQTTIDPRQLEEWDNKDALNHCMISFATGFDNSEEMLEKYDMAKTIFDEFSPIKHLNADTPPIMMIYTGYLDQENDGIHHVKFGLNFKEKADKIGNKCTLVLEKHPEKYPGIIDKEDFLISILLKFCSSNLSEKTNNQTLKNNP